MIERPVHRAPRWEGRAKALRLLKASVLVIAPMTMVVASACASDSRPPLGGSQTAAPTGAQPAVTGTPSPAATATAPSILEGMSDQAAAMVTRLGGESMSFLTVLTEEASPRESTTSQERRAAEFIADELRALGYAVSVEEFPVEVLRSDEPVLSTTPSGGKSLFALPLTLSGRGRATGKMIDVGKASTQDIPAEGLEGHIALIERGEFSFEEKVTRVAAAGAAAAVIYNNSPGIFGGTLMQQGTIPAVSISKEDGRFLLDLLEGSELRAVVSVVFETRRSQNVIAQQPNADSRAVVIGGHYDTVANVQGANDNGSGIAAMITLARETAGRDYPFSLRFVAFGSEELGLLGSRHYVGSLTEEQRDRTLAMINLDALAKGPAVITGDLQLTDQVLDYAGEHGIPVKRRLVIRGSSSDHASFKDAGIPVVSFFGEDASVIHTVKDTLSLVDPDSIGVAVTLALKVLDALSER